MSTQESNFSRRKGLKRSVLVGVAALSMGVSLVFTPSTSAHNIDLPKARELAKEYARG
jgi:hypothetical protein